MRPGGVVDGRDMGKTHGGAPTLESQIRIIPPNLVHSLV